MYKIPIAKPIIDNVEFKAVSRLSDQNGYLQKDRLLKNLKINLKNF